jgi:nucleoside-diphosphate-sugar epimerase
VRILLIGGSGFIGRFLVERLVERGHEVAVFTRGERSVTHASGVRAIRGDRRRLGDSREPLRQLHPEVVVDLALSSGRQASDLMSVFEGGTRRIVALSSIDVYRACGILHALEEGPLEPLPLTEDSALRTRLQPYPADQIRALQNVFGWLDDEYEKILVEREILADPSRDACVLRLPMVYGPGDPLRRQAALLNQMRDLAGEIFFEETMAAWRSPRGYVENVAEAIALATVAGELPHRVYNVAEPDALSELEWAQLVAKAAGWGGRFTVLPRERAPNHLLPPGNLAQHWVTDSTRIRVDLGYVEPVPRAEALRRTVEWERSQPPSA